MVQSLDNNPHRSFTNIVDDHEGYYTNQIEEEYTVKYLNEMGE
jgi:hypothetical protein